MLSPVLASWAHPLRLSLKTPSTVHGTTICQTKPKDNWAFPHREDLLYGRKIGSKFSWSSKQRTTCQVSGKTFTSLCHVPVPWHRWPELAPYILLNVKGYLLVMEATLLGWKQQTSTASVYNQVSHLLMFWARLQIKAHWNSTIEKQLPAWQSPGHDGIKEDHSIRSDAVTVGGQ